jgi:hypothetical protein
MGSGERKVRGKEIPSEIQIIQVVLNKKLDMKMLPHKYECWFCFPKINFWPRDISLNELLSPKED